MKTMLKDLDDLTEMVKEDDVKDMKGTMSDTSQFIKEQGRAFEKLKKKIKNLNDDAESVFTELDFYEDPEIKDQRRAMFEELQKPQKKATEDEESLEIRAGGH